MQVLLSPFMMFDSVGILKYFDDSHKLIVEVDPEIVRYYRYFVPEWVKLNKQKHKPHISVVRNETPNMLDKWGLHENQEVSFQYSNDIQHGQVYYWLEVYSQDLEYIRAELGLTPHSDITMPPDHNRCFHITIGNLKGW